MKYLILGFIIYFIYKFMYRPALEEPVQHQRFMGEDDFEDRSSPKSPRGSDEDYIEYEELE